ncbi:hypothetical protein OS242_01685 [Tumebacillus sp. DT12]|uniref:Uncharacterized protein n=1 Tax=Tumebacillus lacus TaxID=2995335 RepID=A0ABT3WVQ5_9BACL|nr:hypothetical protein [Tumebacillus lacus]MCX7568681.1 hypothetical protein [Tumebacillus lacus]
MQSAILRNAFHFHEIAENVLSLVRDLVGAKTFFIAYTNQEVFTVLKLISEENSPLRPDSLPLESSY